MQCEHYLKRLCVWLRVCVMYCRCQGLTTIWKQWHYILYSIFLYYRGVWKKYFLEICISLWGQHFIKMKKKKRKTWTTTIKKYTKEPKVSLWLLPRYSKGILILRWFMVIFVMFQPVLLFSLISALKKIQCPQYPPTLPPEAVATQSALFTYLPVYCKYIWRTKSNIHYTMLEPKHSCLF